MFKEKFSINFFHKDKNGKNNYKQIIINSQDGKNKSYLKHYRDYYRFFNTSILEQDNFLSWVKDLMIIVALMRVYKDLWGCLRTIGQI